MARGGLPDPVTLAVYGGLAFLLLRPGADGKSMLQRFLGGTFGPPVPGAPGAPGPSAPAAPPGANSGGADSFNFNTQESRAWFHENGGTVDGRAAFGHVGSGGGFSLVVEARDGGLFGSGLFGGDYTKIYETPLGVGDDGDWTGYGVDFASAGALSPGLVHNVQVRFSIAKGSLHYTDAQVWAAKTF